MQASRQKQEHIHASHAHKQKNTDRRTCTPISMYIFKIKVCIHDFANLQRVIHAQ